MGEKKPQILYIEDTESDRNLTGYYELATDPKDAKYARYTYFTKAESPKEKCISCGAGTDDKIAPTEDNKAKYTECKQCNSKWIPRGDMFYEKYRPTQQTIW